MHIDGSMSLAGLAVGLLVGLTGMGGGALMTPMLVLLFGVPPLAAVSSDLVTSLVMKPVGALVHLRVGTVNRRLVGWLVAGAVPTAFAGVLVLRAAGRGPALQADVKLLLGAVLLLSVAAMGLRGWLAHRRRLPPVGVDRLTVRPVRTLLIGVAGGLAVGTTSVGAGSLIIAMLLIAYPGLRSGDLVGSDLVQAVPLVAAAAAGHLLFGDVRLAVTGSLLVGALPGVLVGSLVSARFAGDRLRPLIVAVLLAAGLQLLHLPPAVAAAGGVAVAAGTALASRLTRARRAAPVARPAVRVLAVAEHRGEPAPTAPGG